MKISEFTLTQGNTLATQQLYVSAQRQRLVGLQFYPETEETETLPQLLRHFDVVQVDNQAVVPFTALTPLTKAFAQRGDQTAVADLNAIHDSHRVFWQAGRFNFDVTEKPLIYGILNVSPDSFYDGGRFVAFDDMQQQVTKMVDAGVDVIEIGGQTTRPGFTAIDPEVEWQRVAPVIDFLTKHFPHVPLALDTYKYPVMAKAVEAGVDIINDVNAFVDDPRKLKLMADSEVGLLTMHSNRDVEYTDLSTEMLAFFTKNLDDLVAAGINRDRIALDQGIGYAKVADGQQDYTMMRNIELLNQFQRPLMIAISRKGFGAQLFNLQKDDRLAVTLIAESAMFLRGGNILRVHDIAETVQLRKMLQVIESAYWLPTQA
ncbi:dihydropteroate synthase [Lacticaseibacillus porcinae]|uniref:dihydropteroate synthase n=1 Tax=Lacticaseibacillus porcinae TaxID=1123687 RepID=UPI000F78FE35|nr:dihydropteroate synthase [Lacticaseibacillus porcinae]